jgi:hypothetical protein
MNVTQSQLDAICGEAKAQGLRAVVHAHDPASIIAAVHAGCSQIEHGLFADDAAIRTMKEANIFFDPNIGVVLQNYLERRKQFLGSGSYTEEGFAFMEKAVPTLGPLFKRARAAGLRMPLGTDAVAGATAERAWDHRARQQRRPAADGGVVSATSLAAESLGLGTVIGSLAPGFEADIIAVTGDPRRDITAMQSDIRDEGRPRGKTAMMARVSSFPSLSLTCRYLSSPVVTCRHLSSPDLTRRYLRSTPACSIATCGRGWSRPRCWRHQLRPQDVRPTPLQGRRVRSRKYRSGMT